MNASDRRSRVEAFRRDMQARAKARRAEWAAGIVQLGGTGPFAGIGDPVLRSSYLESARSLLDNHQDRLPHVALPIFFLQRHALELALKYAIQTVARYHHLACRCPGPQPDALRLHDLKKLASRFEEWLEPGEGDKTVALMQLLVGRFHQLDAGGTWARYRDDAGPARLDLRTTQGDLEDLFERLFADPADVSAPVGTVVEYAYLTGELVRGEHDGKEAESA